MSPPPQFPLYFGSTNRSGSTRHQTVREGAQLWVDNKLCACPGIIRGTIQDHIREICPWPRFFISTPGWKNTCFSLGLIRGWGHSLVVAALCFVVHGPDPATQNSVGISCGTWLQLSLWCYATSSLNAQPVAISLRQINSSLLCPAVSVSTQASIQIKRKESLEHHVVMSHNGTAL